MKSEIKFLIFLYLSNTKTGFCDIRRVHIQRITLNSSNDVHNKSEVVIVMFSGLILFLTNCSLNFSNTSVLISLQVPWKYSQFSWDYGHILHPYTPHSSSNYYYYFTLFRVFITRVSRWLLTGFWATASLHKSPKFFSLFWPIVIMQ